MNTQKILSDVEKLHQSAAKYQEKPATLKIGKDTYFFEFDGSNFVVTGPEISGRLNFNTRKISVARQWLREYLKN